MRSASWRWSRRRWRSSGARVTFSASPSLVSGAARPEAGSDLERRELPRPEIPPGAEREVPEPERPEPDARELVDRMAHRRAHATDQVLAPLAHGHLEPALRRQLGDDAHA